MIACTRVYAVRSVEEVASEYICIYTICNAISVNKVYTEFIILQGRSLQSIVLVRTVQNRESCHGTVATEVID